MIRLARLAPRACVALHLDPHTGIEGHVTQVVPIAQERLDAQRVLARAGSAGTYRGGGDCIVNILHRGGAQPHREGGKEAPRRHREIAPAVGRLQAVEPGADQLLIAPGARAAQGLDADGRKQGCIVRHLQPMMGVSRSK
jgi:hypothetical protein